VKVASHYRELDLDLLLLGVLFHDLGKIRELGAMPVNDYTVEGRLVGHVVIGRDLLVERCAAIPDFPRDLQVQLEHLVLSHQGKKEYSAAVEPMTSEALVLHFIDDLDAKVNQLRLARERGSGLQFMKGLGRYFYLDGLTRSPLPEEGEGDEEAWPPPADDGDDGDDADWPPEDLEDSADLDDDHYPEEDPFEEEPFEGEPAPEPQTRLF